MAEQYTEIADVIIINNQPLTTARFYNNRVRADSFAPFTVPFFDFTRLKDLIPPKFVSLVQLGNTKLKNVAISHAEDNRNEVKEIANGLKMEIVLGENVLPAEKLETTYTWDAAADTVTVERSNNYDITWGEWLLWVKWVRDFCDTVNLYKGAQ